MGGVPVNLVIVSPTNSLVESLTTSGSGTFTTTITTDSLGSWEILPQALSTGYSETSQGALLSFEVVPLTIPEIVMLKAAEFAQPPLVFLPAGLVVATVAGVGIKKGVFQGLFKNGKGAVKEEEASEGVNGDDTGEPSKEASTYRRRSSR
jgi:hypothetical protein